MFPQQITQRLEQPYLGASRTEEMAALGPTCPSRMVTPGGEVLPGLDIIPCGCLAFNPYHRRGDNRGARPWKLGLWSLARGPHGKGPLFQGAWCDRNGHAGHGVWVLVKRSPCYKVIQCPLLRDAHSEIQTPEKASHGSREGALVVELPGAL